MPERNIGQEILEGIREIKKYKAGQVELKTTQVSNLPKSGRHILAQFDENSVVVYQAYSGSIPILILPKIKRFSLVVSRNVGTLGN